MTRKTPAYLKKMDDPIALVACRDRRLSVQHCEKSITEHIRQLRICSPIVSEVFGAGVLRKALWRPLRTTFAGDALEAAGLSDAPVSDLCLSVGEISGRAFGGPPRTERDVTGWRMMRDLDNRPRSRWSFGVRVTMDRGEDKAHLSAPDAVLLEKDKEWRRKLGASLPGSMQPCRTPRRAACELVYQASILASWRTESLAACEALAAASRFAGADVSWGDINAAIHERYNALAGTWKRGEPIVRLGLTTIAGNHDRAQASLFDDER